MSLYFMLTVIAWVIFSYFWDGRTRNKEKILAEIRETYSRHEVMNFIYEMKAQAMLLGLAYGALIGMCAVLALRH